MDIIWINHDPALHIVDKEIGFQTAVFINERKPENIWNGFINCWESVYDGLPKNIILDDNNRFISELFQNISRISTLSWRAMNDKLIKQSLKMNPTVTIYYTNIISWTLNIQR